MLGLLLVPLGGGEATGGYGAPAVGYSASASGYEAPTGGYDAPESGYAAPSDGYAAPSSGYTGGRRRREVEAPRQARLLYLDTVQPHLETQEEGGQEGHRAALQAPSSSLGGSLQLIN